MNPPSRREVCAAVRAVLLEELAVLERVTEQARDEATSEQSRPENKYDTRALEASYLAAGQGERLGTARQMVAWSESLVDTPPAQVGDGALLGLDLDGQPRWVMLAAAGGPTVSVGGVEVALVSRQSPLGRALNGALVGDSVEVRGPKGSYDVELLTLS